MSAPRKNNIVIEIEALGYGCGDGSDDTDNMILWVVAESVTAVKAALKPVKDKLQLVVETGMKLSEEELASEGVVDGFLPEDAEKVIAKIRSLVP